MPNNKIIKEIKITTKSKLVISTVELAGKLKLDIRLHVFYFSKKTRKEDFYPTQKGINVPIKHCKEIFAGIKEVPVPEVDSCEEEK